MKRFAIMIIGAVVAVSTVDACSSAPEDNLLPCDPNAILPAPACVKQTSVTEDAGTDAESDAATDAMQSAKEPGLMPSVFPTCTAECVPEASGPTALDWTNEPLIVWFGPRSELDAMSCPGGLPYEKVRGFDKLVAPPAKCDACTCLADGACTGLPENIEIRSGKCNVSNVQTTPFDGPPNWNGSCTSANAMAAGKLCNGVFCAQSVSTSALPAPTNESCMPAVEKPNATLDKHEWLEGALACGAKDLEGTCAVTPEHCVEPLPDGWLRCIARTGKHEACPDNYNDSGPYWVYQDNPIDDRGCSVCTCGAPKDGVCIGSLRLYSDAQCANELNKYQLASTDPFCADLSPPGLAVGSKTFGELSYWPGTCAVTGGEPIGAAVPNDNENSGVRTFCCRAPAPPPLPPPG